MMRVLVMGAVPAQGIHYVPEGTDLMFALLYCGGKTEQTDLEDITIRRRGVRDLIEIDLADLTEEGRPVPKLHDGDLITVGYNWRKNYNTFLTITGVFTSITGFLLSLVALTK